MKDSSDLLFFIFGMLCFIGLVGVGFHCAEQRHGRFIEDCAKHMRAFECENAYKDSNIQAVIDSFK